MAEINNNLLANLNLDFSDLDFSNLNISGPNFGMGGNFNNIPSGPISLPITPINFPTKNINEIGLLTNTSPIKTSPTKDLSLVESLDAGVLTPETIDVSSRAIDFVINVVSDIYVETPDIREITYPKIVRGADFIGYDVDFDISWNSVNATYVKLYIGKSTEYIELPPNGTQTLNVQHLLDKYKAHITDTSSIKTPKDKFTKSNKKQIQSNGDKLIIPIRLIPVNGGGPSFTSDLTDNKNKKPSRQPVLGRVEELPILFDKGDLEIPRTVVVNRIVEGFISQFDKCNFDDSQFLTHLFHLGDGDNKLITTWQGLKMGSDSSLILKLYEPLPTSVLTNQKVWITKIQANAIIDTITLVGDGVDFCPALKGPNFTLEVDNSTGYQMYDDLVVSDQSTSTQLIQKYVSESGIDTEKLNIEYVKDSLYAFENYVHFGSSEERIKNFWYKIQLLESYQSKYTELTSNTTQLGFMLAEGGASDGFVIITEDSQNIEIDALSVTTSTLIESKVQLTKINELIGTFDGFEKFLYTSTDNLAYPKTGNVIDSTTDSTSESWYNYAVNVSSIYDKNNVNYLNNNLPEFITEDYQNEDFMLFMDMTGHHYDTIWAYINGLTKIKSPQHKSDLGFSNDLIHSMLESLGWDGKKAYDSQYLWEYAFGQHKDGTQKYGQSLKSANEEIWRRLLNNLPYILKNKGTSRSIKAVMACYGIPNSLLTIMEFGGPTDPTDGGTTQFTFEDRTAALNFSNGGEFISTAWKEVDGTYPNAVEMTVNLETPADYTLLKGASTPTSTPLWKVGVTNTRGTFGTIDLYVSESDTGTVHSSSTAEVNIFNDEYTQIVINRDLTETYSQFQIIVKEGFDGRIRSNSSSNIMTIVGDTGWNDGSDIVSLGYETVGKVDEFRLWKQPLEDSVIKIHTLQPDSIVGNSYTASTEDLWVRYDFEYPKDRGTSTDVKNVAISTEYATPFGTADGFTSITEYPYQYTPYDRDVTATVPSLGFNSSDKIRFETQTLQSDLSHKVRATKKSFDRAPIDSSRLGLFFSPVKELNMDILKSFGSFNVDDYIGDPSDEFKDNYSELKTIRDYYFQRTNVNIYEYINLVRGIDKSLFEVLESLAPARAKVSKGLLIEPHYLERSKTKWKPVVSERGDYDTSIDVEETINLLGDNNQFDASIDGGTDIRLSHQYDNYDVNIDAEADITLESTVPSYNSLIDIDSSIELEGNYPTYISEIQVETGANLTATAESFGFEQIGMERDSLSNAGFGLFTSVGNHTIIGKYDIFGNFTESRQQVYLIKEQYKEIISTQTQGYPATTNDEQVKYEDVEVIKYKYKVSTLGFGSSDPTVGNDVVEVTPLNGYFPTHYRYKNNLSQGMKNSFFEGSVQDSTTTPDGLSPVETFTTNPNILRVADTGRGSGEPILQTD